MRRPGSSARLFHQAADGRPRDAVLLGDFRQGHARAAILDDLLPIHVEPRSARSVVPPAVPGHATFDAFNDE